MVAGTSPSSFVSLPARNSSFYLRCGLTTLLLIGEIAGLSIAVDTEPLVASGGFIHIVGAVGPWGLRALILALVLTLVFGYPAWPSNRERILESLGSSAWRPAALALHLVTFALFSLAAVAFCTGRILGVPGALLGLTCAASGVASIATGLIAFFPVEFWRRLRKSAPQAPLYAALTSAAAVALVFAAQWISKPWLRLTYRAVVAGLALFRGNIVQNPHDFTIGTPSFSVEIAPACTGYEGVALILVFGSAWLWVFRKEFRFPQALLLLPVGVVAIWLLNIVRIVGLILLGDAGAPAIAAGGFHSQAGWIAFVIMAVSFSLACERVPWIASASRPARKQVADPTAAYLAPFLAILAAGMLAQAASAGFEWFYPIRVVAAAAALFWFRREYSNLEWRPSWNAVRLGMAVFALWIAAERLLPGSTPLPMPGPLAAASTAGRLAWIALRVVGAVITVPIAEELAFRGYLLRRLISPDFESVDFKRFALVPLVVSSAIFGAMHGSRWIPGILAGLIFAEAARRRGRISDAIGAHAISNALLAALVLLTGDWRWW